MFLMKLLMVSGNSKYPREGLLKVSWISNLSLPRIHLSSKSLPGVLEDMNVNDCRVLKMFKRRFTENYIIIQHQEASQDLTFPPSLSLESWRTWMFLMELEMVSGYTKYPIEGLLKVSSRSNIRKLVKTTNIIKVSFWSLGGHGGS